MNMNNNLKKWWEEPTENETSWWDGPTEEELEEEYLRLVVERAHSYSAFAGSYD